MLKHQLQDTHSRTPRSHSPIRARKQGTHADGHAHAHAPCLHLRHAHTPPTSMPTLSTRSHRRATDPAGYRTCSGATSGAQTSTPRGLFTGRRGGGRSRTLARRRDVHSRWPRAQHHAHTCTRHSHPARHRRPYPAHAEHPFSPLNNRYSGLHDLLRDDRWCSNIHSDRLVHTPTGRRPDSSPRRGLRSRWPRPRPPRPHAPAPLPRSVD